VKIANLGIPTEKVIELGFLKELWPYPMMYIAKTSRDTKKRASLSTTTLPASFELLVVAHMVQLAQT